jgi:hypothetical protein
MIRMFSSVSLQGLGDPQVLSHGISEAMLATAEGLCIGIPALVAYNYFTSRGGAADRRDRGACRAASCRDCVRSGSRPDERHRVPQAEARKQIDLNVTSLVDVLFLLLIFFTLTSTFKRAGEIELQLPKSTTGQPSAAGASQQPVDLC